MLFLSAVLRSLGKFEEQKYDVFFVITISTEGLTSHGTKISSNLQQLNNTETEKSDDSLLVLEFDSTD